MPDARLAARLARRRIPIGFVCAAAVLWLAHPTAASLMIGAAIALAGEGLRIWAAGHLNKSREVTSSGPYRFFAHPLYVGSSIMGIGLAIASASVVVAMIVGAYLAATLTAAMKSEEAFLTAKFGAAYGDYRRVGAAAPPQQRRSFSTRLAIANREYRALAGLVVAVLLLLLKATYNGTFWAPPSARP